MATDRPTFTLEEIAQAVEQVKMPDLIAGEFCELLALKWRAKANAPSDAALTSPARPNCTACGKPYIEHGSYPTCASHPYSGDGRCGAVGTLERGSFIGLPCVGAQCINGCARATQGERNGE